MDNGATLCALLEPSHKAEELQATLEHIGEVVQTLRDAAADINPVLSVEVDQVPSGDAAVLRIAVTCHHDPQGIEAVQQLVAMAPAMPSGIQVYAFSPPIPKQVLRGLGTLELAQQVIPIRHVLFTAQPNPQTPGTFDICCFVPSTAVTPLDVEGPPGALVAHIVLSLGIGELRVMTRVSGISITVASRAPADAVAGWDLIEVIDSAPVH